MTKRRLVMSPVATITHSGAPATMSGSAASCAEPAYTSSDIMMAQGTVSPPLTIATPLIIPQANAPGSEGRMARWPSGTPRGVRRSGGVHHTPVLAIDTQGSRGGSEPSFCSSSMEMLSGERTKAMRPSRGGRLMVTPCFCRRSQVA